MKITVLHRYLLAVALVLALDLISTSVRVRVRRNRLFRTYRGLRFLLAGHG